MKKVFQKTGEKNARLCIIKPTAKNVNAKIIFFKSFSKYTIVVGRRFHDKSARLETVFSRGKKRTKIFRKFNFSSIKRRILVFLNSQYKPAYFIMFYITMSLFYNVWFYKKS